MVRNDMLIRFRMNREDVGSGFDKIGCISFRMVDHEVHIQRDRRCLFRGPDDNGADGDVRHEMAVHYVYMNEVRSRLFHIADLLTQSREITTQNGRGNTHVSHFILRSR